MSLLLKNKYFYLTSYLRLLLKIESALFRRSQLVDKIKLNEEFLSMGSTFEKKHSQIATLIIKDFIEK